MDCIRKERERELKAVVAGNQRVIAYLIASHFSDNPSPHVTSITLFPTHCFVCNIATQKLHYKQGACDRTFRRVRVTNVAVGKQ